MPSAKKQQIYEYVTKCWQEDGLPPSIREICAALGIKSTSSVHKYLGELSEEGLITKSRFKKRCAVPASAPRSVSLPILGRVAAGVPITAQQDFEGFISVPAEAGGEDRFALRIKGDSMKNAGIMNGDIVVVRRENYAENGEIVVALIEDEATVKRFFRERDGSVRLQPENDDYEPILAERVTILGRVTACMRYY